MPARHLPAPGRRAGRAARLVAIDPTIPGVAIKDRAEGDPLAPATIDRIKAGIRRYWLPLLTPAGGTWRDQAIPLHWPMPARTTTESDGVAVPPLLVPVEGRPGKLAAPATAPQRTQTARNETALAQLPLPFLTPLRGGGDTGRARPVTDPLTTVCAAGNHHGLALPPRVMRNTTGDAEMTTPADEPIRTITTAGHQSVVTWAQQLLVPYYGNADAAQPASAPVGALTSRDRYGLAQPGHTDLDRLIGDVLFRMLEPHEIAAAMAFDPDYKVVARTKREGPPLRQRRHPTRSRDHHLRPRRDRHRRTHRVHPRRLSPVLRRPAQSPSPSRGMGRAHRPTTGAVTRGGHCDHDRR